MAYNAFNDKNVLFLQGNQTKLNDLITNGGATEGAFYLTNDTHRLYVGRNNGTKTIPVAVNEGVVTVANVNALPISGVNAGEFYYATAENILCVYNGQQFIQINTDQNNIISSLTNTVSAENNIATVKTEVVDDKNTTIQDTFQIKDSSGHTLITVTGDVIDLKADEYTLSSSVGVENSASTATIKLESANTTEDSTVKIAAGDNITIDADGDNKFKISSSYHNTTNASLTSEITSAGTVKVTVTDSDGAPVSGESAAITYKVGTTDYIPGQTLPVYTKTEIDTKINGLNGMTYKGTVGTNNTLPVITAENTSTIQVGDTYLVDADDKIALTEDNSYDNVAVTAGKGDLLIATGDETNGFITDNLKWSYVPAGDDAEHDTTYSWTGEDTSNKKVLQTTGAGEAGSWQLTAGTAMTVSSTGTDDMVTTIGHADVEHKDEDGTEENNVQSLTVVSDVDVNAQGHVTTVTKTKYNLQDTTYTLSGGTVESITGGVKITDTLTPSVGGTSTSVTSVTSETLTMTAGTNSYTVDIKWGTF
jgi:uncharacterized protein YxjI